MPPRPLGVTQKYVLESLQRHGEWYPQCGWMWDTFSGTVKIMESLVKRGLVSSRTARLRPASPSFVIYTLTDAGREVIK